ncbi:helix-turn-helix domain-containing protein [Acinetobacter dispersus]|uniref:helix-turn-helix domain-containing protein n=1 Tax=Acinetobacter dispersus TaxID=70348 RepID=UPI001F4B3DDB|nr:helix-turn-helix domain-containing protein [Acinetobacter dispersus]MCH7394222.1 helix-turn-helix domain-containing protein [Acinetobacter dispersus]
MLNMKIEKERFLHHVRTLGVVSVQWDKHGVITGISREAYCSIGYDNIELMWNTWLAAKQNGVVLNEHDIETAIQVEGTAVKKIVSHIEMAIIQKALIFSKGNQRLAADQIGMSRTKLGCIVRGIKSKTNVRAAA